MLLAVLDLNFEPLIRHSAMNLFAGVIDAHGKAGVCAVMEHLPLTTFRHCVARYGGDHKVKRFTCLDQYLSMAFAQLSFRESLRDIEACLGAQSSKLYHLAFAAARWRAILANANATRDWRIYCESHSV